MAECKTNIIELPCKAGETVYYIRPLYPKFEIVKCIVNEFCVAQDGTFAVLDIEKNGIVYRRMTGIPIAQFGSTVHFTQGKAEQALRDMI